jgi:glutaredoxin-like protein NrdH
MAAEVFVYALSTCPWCRKTKQWFADSEIDFEFVDVDTLPSEAQDEVADKVYQISGGRRFPVVVIKGAVIVGYNPDEFLDSLNSGGDEP